LKTATQVRDVAKLLAKKHSDDVFVEEVKNGPSWTGGDSTCRRIDAWAMKKSWSRPALYGYEIKVSRSDFLGDDKWPAYLDMCNMLCFVAPADVIKPEEVPEQVGLITVSKTGTRLYTKKKAPHREIEPPVDTLLYLLMRASGFGGPEQLGMGHRAWTRQSNIEYWRDWLADKKEAREIGHRASMALRHKYAADVSEVQHELRWLKAELAKLSEVKVALDAAGVSVSDPRIVNNLARAARGELTVRDRNSLQRAHDALGELLERGKS